MRRLGWVMSTALAVGVAIALPTSGAGASGRTSSLSSLVVPPPHGFHESVYSEFGGIRTGAITFAQASSSACKGAVPRVTPRSQWLGSELRYYTSAPQPGGVMGILLVCVTRLVSVSTAARIAARDTATYYAAVNVIHSHVRLSEGSRLFTVPGIPHSIGFEGGAAGFAILKEISFARGRYVVFVVGTGTPAGAKLAPTLSRQQYARLR
jgi:hypothetical protein